jgi:hypothetical protein
MQQRTQHEAFAAFAASKEGRSASENLEWAIPSGLWLPVADHTHREPRRLYPVYPLTLVACFGNMERLLRMPARSTIHITRLKPAMCIGLRQQPAKRQAQAQAGQPHLQYSRNKLDTAKPLERSLHSAWRSPRHLPAQDRLRHYPQYARKVR